VTSTVVPMSTDWRAPELRRELFQRSYTFSLRHLNFPGMVYSMLPAIADHFDLDEEGRAWLAWLNGNTQNVVTSMLILEEARGPGDWKKAVDFVNENFRQLEWDTDRRHQKSKFAEATEQWFMDYGHRPAQGWLDVASSGPEASWDHAIGHPYMGRISAWSFLEFARILIPEIPDVPEWYLKESSSRSHRNALCMLLGYDDAWSWDREKSEIPFMLDLLPRLHELAEDLLKEADERNAEKAYGSEGPEYQVQNPHVSRLTMESALCTFKSWHKPDRRYPNVYADMMYQRIKKAESRFDRSLDLLWDIRKETLPASLRLEDMPYDPGMVSVKQNWYQDMGQVHYLHTIFPDMEPSGFELRVDGREYGQRKDPKWS
jgi:hypothetical protein